MANEIKLEIHSFGITNDKKPVNEKIKHLPFNNFDDSTEFLDFFKEYLKYLETKFEANETLKKAMRLEDKSLTWSSEKGIVSGVFQSGAYGYESEIFSLSKNSKKMKKEKDDLEIIPFYFLLHAPKDKNIGILILQRFGINGISTVFKNSLYKFFSEKYQKLYLDFQPLVTKELAQAFSEDGGIKEIILKKFNLPSDKADKLGLNAYYEHIQSIELRVRAKKRHTFLGLNKNLKSMISDPNTKFFSVQELKDIGFDGSYSISVVSKLNGSERTIDLSDTGRIKPYYDIDHDVRKKASGQPEFGSIDKIAKDMLKEILSE